MKFIQPLICIALLVGLDCAAAEDQVDDPRIDARLLEIGSYDDFDGAWEGTVQITSAPKMLISVLEKNGTMERGMRIRLDLESDAEPKIALWYADADDWSKLEGDIATVPSSLGLFIVLERSEGLWIEKYSITLDRVSEDEIALTFNRTVHNWLITDPSPDYVDFYHMYGVGRITRSASSAVE